MAARKHHIAHGANIRPDTASHAVADPAVHEPIESPALLLQGVLREAGFEDNVSRHRRRMTRAMLALSLVCVYTLAVLMLTGRLTV